MAKGGKGEATELSRRIGLCQAAHFLRVNFGAFQFPEELSSSLLEKSSWVHCLLLVILHLIDKWGHLRAKNRHLNRASQS